ncbi:pilus assembly FimT family protein [Aquimarina aquimarini]|uniref:pilus assembly FimT family protein n=1 Tax=Aquimarina aquimarini TaxID=1191734 RepID=UPI000D55C1C7|nr:hypothetical protein [Aquimarina aquimarini]
MVVLKKIKGATLIEVLTASVLIVIVFMIASLSFNTVFSNQIKRDRTAIDNRVKELEYLFIHHKIKLPYTEDFDGWEVIITSMSNHTVLLYSKGDVELKKRLIVK